VRSTLLVSLPLALLLTLTAGVTISLLYGASFSDAAVVLAILAWKVPLSAVGAPFNAALLSHERQVVQMRNAMIGAGLTLALVPALVLLASVQGAAVGSIVGLLVTVSLNIRSCVAFGIVPGFRGLLRR
jgi:O-antigen/teichoic acid export membrane protein